MRYAIISDIHANLEALTAVLAHTEQQGTDKIVCLGDIVGYHADPNECVTLVREQATACIAGNHDRAAAGIKQPLHFGYIGRQAILWTRAALDEKNRQFLARLPLTLQVDDRFLTVHGALHPRPNEDLHLSTRERVKASMAALVSDAARPRLCFYGHTHRTAVYEYRHGTLSELPAAQIQLSEGAHYLINPGSVGQPRDGTMTASYAIFDTTTATVDFQRVSFDFDTCRRKALAVGLLRAPPRTRACFFWASDRVDATLSAVNRLARRVRTSPLV